MLQQKNIELATFAFSFGMGGTSSASDVVIPPCLDEVSELSSNFTAVDICAAAK